MAESHAFDSREERIAYNEALSRDLNEKKAEWMKDGHPVAGFRCECGRSECSERIQLAAGEWDEARRESTRFVVAPGHIIADVERLVKEYPHAWLVEKHGRAAEVAEELDATPGMPEPGESDGIDPSGALP